MEIAARLTVLAHRDLPLEEFAQEFRPPEIHVSVCQSILLQVKVCSIKNFA